MSDRDRRHYVGAPLAAVALLAVAYFTEPKAVSVGDGEAEQDCPYKTYTVRSGPDGGFEFGIARDDKACKKQSTADEYAETSPHAPRNIQEADLLAQQRMAHWTLWIGVFTAVGLSVLYITFHATRRAVEETREIGQTQTKAYLAAVSCEYVVRAKRPLSARLKLKNFGQSPASGVMFTPEYLFTILDKPPPNSKNAAIYTLKGFPNFPRTIAAGAEEEFDLDLAYRDQRDGLPFGDEILQVSINAKISFQDAFTRRRSIRVSISEETDAPVVGLRRATVIGPVKLTVRTSEPQTGEKEHGGGEGEEPAPASK